MQVNHLKMLPFHLVFGFLVSVLGLTMGFSGFSFEILFLLFLVLILMLIIYPIFMSLKIVNRESQ